MKIAFTGSEAGRSGALKRAQILQLCILQVLLANIYQVVIESLSRQTHSKSLAEHRRKRMEENYPGIQF